MDMGTGPCVTNWVDCQGWVGLGCTNWLCGARYPDCIGIGIGMLPGVVMNWVSMTTPSMYIGGGDGGACIRCLGVAAMVVTAMPVR